MGPHNDLRKIKIRKKKDSLMDTHDTIINLRHALMLSSLLFLPCRLRF